LALDTLKSVVQDVSSPSMPVESSSKRWVIVAYDLPNEPSRLRLKAWRNFKKLGAVYPSVSLCILPDTPQVRKRLDQERADISKNGSILVLDAQPLEKVDDERLFKIFEEDRHKQYDEMLEECQEFLDEIKENLGKKNVTPEETDELGHAFEGLERWYNSIRDKGYGNAKDSARVGEMMKKCKDALTSFSASARPKTINTEP
jgi:hypothetical protein